MKNYLFVIVVPVESALLLALLAVDGRPVLDLGIRAPLAFVAYERGDDVAVLAGSRFTVSFHVLLALFTYCARAALRSLLELGTAVRAFHDRESAATFLHNTTKQCTVK